jgi:hypothetical protein
MPLEKEPPLHAVSPFGLCIQLACAVCTIGTIIIIFTTTIATAAIRASVTVAITTPVNEAALDFELIVIVYCPIV